MITNVHLFLILMLEEFLSESSPNKSDNDKECCIEDIEASNINLFPKATYCWLVKGLLFRLFLGA